MTDAQKLITIITAVGDDRAMLLQLLQEAETNPTVWTLPGMAQLKPFAAGALPLLLFLTRLQGIVDGLESVVPPTV